VLEEGHDLLDRILHSEELAEGGIPADDAVAENAGEARVAAGVDELRLTDACQHPLGRRRVGGRLPLAQFEILLEGHFLVLRGRVVRPEVVEQRHRHVPKLPCYQDAECLGRFPPLPA
jgi:hypothetical protein